MMDFNDFLALTAIALGPPRLVGVLHLGRLAVEIQARARPRTWPAFAAAPSYLVWKAGVQLRALASVLRRDDHCEPTARA